MGIFRCDHEVIDHEKIDVRSHRGSTFLFDIFYGARVEYEGHCCKCKAYVKQCDKLESYALYVALLKKEKTQPEQGTT